MHEVKFETVLTAPLVHILALLAEVDLFRGWNRFVVESATLARAARFTQTLYAASWIPPPFPDFDVCVRVRGHDAGEPAAALVMALVSVGDWAHELCGGTHAQRSGQLGVVTFLSEGSIGAGVRRVEALVGADAYRFLAREHLLVNRLSELVKAPADELIERIERTITSLKDAERDLAKVRSAQLIASMDGIIGEGRDIGPVRVWAFEAPEGTSSAELREMVMKAKGRSRPELPVVLAGSAVAEGKASIIAAANQTAIDLGVTASLILATALPFVDGRGGGKDDLAQGGGTRPEGVAEALAAVESMILARFAT